MIVLWQPSESRQLGLRPLGGVAERDRRRRRPLGRRTLVYRKRSRGCLIPLLTPSPTMGTMLLLVPSRLVLILPVFYGYVSENHHPKFNGTT